MLIKATWYKESGKWYATSEVDIGDQPLWGENFKQTFVDNQAQMASGWEDHNYYVAIEDLEESQRDRNYRGFYNHLFMPDAFKGLRAKEKTIR